MSTMKIFGKSHYWVTLLLLLFPTALSSSLVGNGHGHLRDQASQLHGEKGQSKENKGPRRRLDNQQQGIIGGTTTTGSAYPFHALLFENANDDTSYGCGGTLIAAGMCHGIALFPSF